MAEFEYPKLLYKFRSWSDKYHKRVLADNELYLAAPKMFNDPFDTKIYPNFDVIDSEEKLEKYTRLFFIKNYSLYSSKTDDFTVVDRLMTNFKDRLASGEHEQMHKDEWDYIYEHHLGIISFAEIRDEILPENNTLLWSHYAQYHTGYCIVFKGEQILKEFQGKFAGSGGNVRYGDYPNIDPFEILDDERFQYSEISKKFTKALNWKYESEYRISALTPQVLEFNRQFVFSNECVEKIILGCDISEADKKEIIGICQSKKWPVYQAKKRKHSFELDFEQVA